MARKISENKQFKVLLKNMEANGIEYRISESIEFALEVYNACPVEAAKKYIVKRNPEAGKIICQSKK